MTVRRRLVRAFWCLLEDNPPPVIELDIIGKGGVRLTRCHNVILDQCAQITLYRCGGILEFDPVTNEGVIRP